VRLPPASALAAAVALAASLASVATPGWARAADPRPGVVDGTTARALAAAGARVVDVRTPQEFAAGHVPGALNIPHDEIARRAAEIGPPSTKVVVYCRSGRRSAIAADALGKLGYPQVYDLGSFSAWPRDPAGAPVKAEAAPQGASAP
jgi:phage shock protein E